jgi:serine phosphatase RsbU (regulator of sigma subunit)
MRDERLRRERDYERDMEDREYERRAAETRQQREYDQLLEDQYNTALEIEHARELLMACCP